MVERKKLAEVGEVCTFCCRLQRSHLHLRRCTNGLTISCAISVLCRLFLSQIFPPEEPSSRLYSSYILSRLFSPFFPFPFRCGVSSTLSNSPLSVNSDTQKQRNLSSTSTQIHTSVIGAECTTGIHGTWSGRGVALLDAFAGIFFCTIGNIFCGHWPFFFMSFILVVCILLVRKCFFSDSSSPLLLTRFQAVRRGNCRTADPSADEDSIRV